jgi:CspA family cold shock protein
MSEREQGTILWYNDSKGFGFITPASGGEAVFLHRTSIDESSSGMLFEGSRVEYSLIPGPKGTVADDVRLMEYHGG